MAICRRSKREKNFSVVDNQIICDTRLKGLSRALLIYILSKPDDWIIRKKDLYKQFPDTKNSIDTALKQLRSVGYAQLKAVQNDEGKLEGQEYVFYDFTVSARSSEDGRSSTSEIIEPRRSQGLSNNGSLLQRTDEEGSSPSFSSLPERPYLKDYHTFKDRWSELRATICGIGTAACFNPRQDDCVRRLLRNPIDEVIVRAERYLRIDDKKLRSNKYPLEWFEQRYDQLDGVQEEKVQLL